MVGWLTPRSIKLTEFLSMPALSASCSCERFADFRAVLKTFPNATDGSKTILPIYWENRVLEVRLCLHNILGKKPLRLTGPAEHAALCELDSAIPRHLISHEISIYPRTI